MRKKENNNQKTISSNYLERTLIKQLQFWFKINQNQYSKFTTISLVGPRRDNLQSHVCSKINSSSKKVLKSFNNLDCLSTWKLIAFELIVPILVDSKNVLKYCIVFDWQWSKINYM